MTIFAWQTDNAKEILGDARPHDVKALIKKGGVWIDLYRGWLADNAQNAEDPQAFEFLLAGGTNDKAYTRQWVDQLDGYFAGFVNDIGTLKASLHQQHDYADVNAALGQIDPGWDEGDPEQGGEAY